MYLLALKMVGEVPKEWMVNFFLRNSVKCCPRDLLTLSFRNLIKKVKFLKQWTKCFQNSPLYEIYIRWCYGSELWSYHTTIPLPMLLLKKGEINLAPGAILLKPFKFNIVKIVHCMDWIVVVAVDIPDSCFIFNVCVTHNQLLETWIN